MLHRARGDAAWTMVRFGHARVPVAEGDTPDTCSYGLLVQETFFISSPFCRFAAVTRACSNFDKTDVQMLVFVR